MARLRPSPAQGRKGLGLGDRAEIAVLERLSDGLPDAYVIYHSVEWTDVRDGVERHGEIDLVVVNQAGELVAIEVKAGRIEAAGDGLYKHYAGRRKDVIGQVSLQHSALRARLDGANLPVRLLHFLVLTDARVQTGSVRWPRERILDSRQWEDLPQRIVAELGPGLPDPLCARVLDFLDDAFHVRPDVSTLVGRVSRSAPASSRRLSAGLADWVPRIEAPSRVIRVVGTAGSGKTQLALHLLREANRRGQRAGYLCFNRALADHIGHHVPVRVCAQTFHQWTDRLLRQAGEQLDYRCADAFERLVRLARPVVAGMQPTLDLLVLDELQDFAPEWAELAVQRLRPDGRLYLLEDPEQQLYDDREPFDIADEVIVRSNENRESSRLCSLNQLGEFRIRRYAGHYDQNGEPVWYDGELLIDSVHRYKGQSAQAVVISECDFEAWTLDVKRRLFVALTRAMVRIEWVMSERAARLIESVLETSADGTDVTGTAGAAAIAAGRCPARDGIASLAAVPGGSGVGVEVG